MTRFTAPLILAAIWCASTSVQAGLSEPIPFAKLSRDEAKILVIRDGGSGFSQSQVTNPQLSNGENIDFQTIFSRSGVYELTTKKLEYPIDWFCLEEELLASDDLESIARLNRFGGDWALKFYSRGVETSSYKLDDLLTNFAEERYRPFVTWDYFHPWHDDFEIRGGQVVVGTVEREIGGFPIGFREIHSFDLVTGALQKTEVQNGPLRMLIAAVGLLLFIITSVVLARRARRRESKQKKSEHRSAHLPRV